MVKEDLSIDRRRFEEKLNSAPDSKKVWCKNEKDNLYQPTSRDATCSRVFLRSERPHFSSRKRKAQVRLAAEAANRLLSMNRS